MCKVSVIIPTYNCGLYIDEALKSIYVQTLKYYEIIIVDDGSTDNTVEVLQKHKHKISYLYQENSGGASKPRNEGIKLSKGKYITFCDADDVMEPNKLMFQSDFLDAHTGIDFVFGDYCNFKGKEVYHRHTSTCPKFRSLEKTKVGDDQYILDKTDAYNTLFFENFIGTSSMMFRAELTKEIGLFDEKLRRSEDIDFSFRVTSKKNIGYVDKVCFFRRLHSTNISKKSGIVLSQQIAVREKQLNVQKDNESQAKLLNELARLFFSLAYSYRKENNLKSSLSCYLKSTKYRPLNFRTYLAMVKTLTSCYYLRLKILLMGG